MLQKPELSAQSLRPIGFKGFVVLFNELVKIKTDDA